MFLLLALSMLKCEYHSFFFELKLVYLEEGTPNTVQQKKFHLKSDVRYVRE